MLVKESISASKLDRLSSSVFSPGFTCTLKPASSVEGGGGKAPGGAGRFPRSSPGSGGGGGGGRGKSSLPGCLYGLYFGFGATTGANFFGDCCVDTEMLGVPKACVVSILAVTCPTGSLVFFGGSHDGWDMVQISSQEAPSKPRMRRTYRNAEGSPRQARD